MTHPPAIAALIAAARTVLESWDADKYRVINAQMDELRAALQAAEDAQFVQSACKDMADRHAKSITDKQLSAAEAAPIQPAPGVGWIDVTERYPNRDTLVIVDGGIAMWNGTKWVSFTGQVREIEWEVTDWQPLPPPPPKGQP